jgi:hypothetical protein
MNNSELASMQMSLMLLTKRVDVLEAKAPKTFQETARIYGNGPQNGFVSLNKAGAMGEPQKTGVIGPDSNAQTIMSYKKFIEGLLEIEVHGLHVTEEVRHAARKVLGR